MKNKGLICLKKSICLFCPLGCGVAFRKEGEFLTAIDYDKENPINHGSLCPRGHYNYEMIAHPGRISLPMIGKRKVDWDEAIGFTKQEIKLFDKNDIGIFVSSNASNEDALAAAKLANYFGIKNIAASGMISDAEAYAGGQWSVEGARLASLDDIEKSEAVLIVGDLLTRAPVLSKRINQVKYGKRGNKIIVADPNQTHTSWFATSHLALRPGSEAVLLAAMAEKITNADLIAAKTGIPAENIFAAAKEFKSAASGVVMVVPNENKERNDLIVYFAKQLAAASPNKKYIVYYNYGNALGVNGIIDQYVPGHLSYEAMLKKVEGHELKALFMLGQNVCSDNNLGMNKKLRMAKFVAVSGYFGRESSITSETLVTFPLASQFEGGGSFTPADGLTRRFDPIVSRTGTKTNAEIAELIFGQESESFSLHGSQLAFHAVNIDDKLAEAVKIEPKESVPVDNVAHFGNNRLVSNFFWFRANN